MGYDFCCICRHHLQVKQHPEEAQGTSLPGASLENESFSKKFPRDIPSRPFTERQHTQGPKPMSGKRHGTTMVDLDESGFVPGARDGLTNS